MIRRDEMNMPGFAAGASLYKSTAYYNVNGNLRFQDEFDANLRFQWSIGQTEGLASSSILAYSSPNGLIASTGNLYWTSKIYNEFGPDTSVVWRAGKNNIPGNEVMLYHEDG